MAPVISAIDDLNHVVSVNTFCCRAKATQSSVPTSISLPS